MKEERKCMIQEVNSSIGGCDLAEENDDIEMI